MGREYYTIGEIILGLRNEYLKFQEQLKELKEMCTMNPKKATDFRFHVYLKEGGNPQLHCYYEPKLNKLQKN